MFSRRPDTIWPWIELIATFVVGLVLRLLKKEELSNTVWVIGTMLSFATQSVIWKLRKEFDSTRKQGEIIDLSQQCDVKGISDILRLYARINESEFASLKDDVIADCTKKLSRLANDKEVEVSGSDYHLWLREMLRSTRSGEKMAAVSVMVESAWINIPAEKSYLEENIEAVQHRGVIIERIFITSRERFRKQENQEVIRRHVDKGLKAYIIFKEELEAQDANLLREIGDGFSQFGQRVALIDTTEPPQEEARGRVTMNPAELRRIQNHFEKLKLNAIEATKHFDKAKSNPLASVAASTNNPQI